MLQANYIGNATNKKLQLYDVSNDETAATTQSEYILTRVKANYKGHSVQLSVQWTIA